MNRIIVDVREPDEYTKGHIKGAINIPPSDILAGADKLKGVQKDTEIILYCLSGSRSNASIKILEKMGFSNLINGINIDNIKKIYQL